MLELARMSRDKVRLSNSQVLYSEDDIFTEVEEGLI